MKRQVKFYKTSSGASPIEDFLDSLPGKVAQKVTWVLSIIEELDIIPSKYFKKIESIEKIYECRIDFGGNTYRLLGFFHSGHFVVLTNGFMKKSDKVPKAEIDLCIKRMKDFIDRGGKL
ncbi:MAG: type II toxin-antitoxin system RelE/ParE family toxin [Alphaproteobacteria bacterium]|nr:MAG: type II toxin-antitoxin system RelE/ParE family toxin [Alphaproteobacteria bacterium]